MNYEKQKREKKHPIVPEKVITSNNNTITLWTKKNHQRITPGSKGSKGFPSVGMAAMQRVMSIRHVT